MKYNNVYFESSIRRNPCEKSKDIIYIEKELKYYGHRNIFDAYARPSQRKIFIWNEWSNYFNSLYDYDENINYIEYGVGGANSHTFTILAHISFKKWGALLHENNTKSQQIILLSRLIVYTTGIKACAC